jgi:hypothetical protein
VTGHPGAPEQDAPLLPGPAVSCAAPKVETGPRRAWLAPAGSDAQSAITVRPAFGLPLPQQKETVDDPHYDSRQGGRRGGGAARSPIARRRDQTEIENGLIASGLGYTLLRNNAYMQNFLMLAPAIAKTSSFGSSTGDGKVGMVDARDVAAVAAEIAASPAAHQGKTYWPTGPESLSYADAAVVLSKVLGQTITFYPLTFDEQKQAMTDAGVPEHIAEMNAQAVTLFAQGDSDWITDDVPSILGQPARTFEQFVTDHAAAFS